MTDEQYTTLQAKAKYVWLRGTPVAYNFGFRKGELLGLKVSQIDLKARTIFTCYPARPRVTKAAPW